MNRNLSNTPLEFIALKMKKKMRNIKKENYSFQLAIHSLNLTNEKNI